MHIYIIAVYNDTTFYYTSTLTITYNNYNKEIQINYYT